LVGQVFDGVVWTSGLEDPESWRPLSLKTCSYTPLALSYIDRSTKLLQHAAQSLTKITKTRANDVLPNTNRSQAAVSVHAVMPSPPAATEWYRLLLHDVISSGQRTPYNALSIGMTQQFFVFCPW